MAGHSQQGVSTGLYHVKLPGCTRPLGSFFSKPHPSGRVFVLQTEEKLYRVVAEFLRKEHSDAFLSVVQPTPIPPWSEEYLEKS